MVDEGRPEGDLRNPGHFRAYIGGSSSLPSNFLHWHVLGFKAQARTFVSRNLMLSENSLTSPNLVKCTLFSSVNKNARREYRGFLCFSPKSTIFSGNTKI